MTAIAAVAVDGRVWMGGDSASIEGNLALGIGKEPKVWTAQHLVFGACGSFRVAQLLQHHMEVPAAHPDQHPLAYLSGPLATAMRDTLEEGGALTTWDEDSTQELTDSALLIGFRGRIFTIWGDFGVGELVHGYGAVGCAEDIVLGNLAATEKFDLKPKVRVRMALEAAERHSGGVRGPFTILRSSLTT